MGQDVLAYDAIGNLVARGADSLPGGVRAEYRYDENARLREVVSHGATTAVYAYNPMGQRIARRAYDGTWWSLYDLQGNWLGEYDNAGRPRQQVIWFAGMPVGVIDRRREGALLEGARLFYVEADALGTPRAVVDPVSTANPWGKAVWRWDLTGEPFGRDLPLDDPDNDGQRFAFDMRFPGQRYDDATGLHYNYFRDYDPQVGRYVQSDPIGLKGGYSTFGYVGSSPMTGIDPKGLMKVYGQWCGPDWTGGKPEEFSPEHVYQRPVDSLDAACRNHDMCYYTCRAAFPCSKSSRGRCFGSCDTILTREAYSIGGFWGRTVGAAIDRPGQRDGGPNDPQCEQCDIKEE